MTGKRAPWYYRHAGLISALSLGVLAGLGLYGNTYTN